MLQCSWTPVGCNGGSAPATPNVPNGSCSNTYRVVSGDTCSAIATKCGTTASAIQGANPSINSGCTNLQVDQVLTISPTQGSTADGTSTCGAAYIVVSGDTCSSIASKCGTTASSIQSANPSVNSACTNLQVGQVLNLSGSSSGNGGSSCASKYTVVSGDYCYAIAQRFGESVANLQTKNPALNCNNLQIGTVLCV